MNLTVLKKAGVVGLISLVAYSLVSCYGRGSSPRVIVREVEKLVYVTGEPQPAGQPSQGTPVPEKRETPLPFTSSLAEMECPAAELPHGNAACDHGDPSIERTLSHDRDEGNPWMDVCSWWGDMAHHGYLPRKRLQGAVGSVPPRSTCWSDRICISSKQLCLGHLNDPNENPLQFCPHHDGPLRISLKSCETSIACGKHHPATCGSQGPGAGRTILMIREKYLIDASNIWHLMNTLMDIFGTIVRADPELVKDGTFHPTSARLTLMLLTMGFHKVRDLSRAAPWHPTKGAEMKQLLESFSNCPLDTPRPEETQCYSNVVMGTPHNVYLQWEDKIIDERHVELATVFAKHLVAHFMSETRGIPGSPVAAPWDRVYEAGREKPKMLLMMRGEGMETRKRQMVNIEILVTEAGSLGFHVVKSDANERSTLKDQAAAAASADVIIGVHGAALGWATVMPPHGVLVELRPGPYLVDRTFIYPNLAASRGLTYIEWHQSEPITPSADPRLALDTQFVITQPTAAYYVALIMNKLVKKAPWFRKTAGWHKD
eukprot:TRINITY_DN17317_c0_g1_i1.p1 TRINITY_DN17317_c0_g1~~TRINITY_DN17317_c0_g1_i1.p1  ORF type:complete len:567 (+),score=62.41 TRINITY_DN17317_c0_g1_i1:70-1701(+)